MDMPPSRYRVVEQGRRLVVVDTRTGARSEAAGPAPAPPQVNRVQTAANAVNAAANPTIVTSRWFDNKAPRTIVLDQSNSHRTGSAVGLVLVAAILLALLAWSMPVLLVVMIFLLGNGSLRRSLRAGVTKWLDGVVQETGSSRG